MADINNLKKINPLFQAGLEFQNKLLKNYLHYVNLKNHQKL